MTGLETLSGAALRHALLHTPALELIRQAARLRDAGHGNRISYSRKVFIPVTHLCRDKCHYCTFVTVPGKLRAEGKGMFMEPDEILEVARRGAELGCKEALFTLGDRPEARWDEAKQWLDERGYDSTLDYVRAMAIRVLDDQQPGLTAPKVAALAWAAELCQLYRSTGVVDEW